MMAHATATIPPASPPQRQPGRQGAVLFDMSAAGIWIARRGFVALNIMIGESEADRFVGAVEEFVAARKALLQPQ
jgi:glutamate-1-semialdehyde 2,1-aminomutase